VICSGMQGPGTTWERMGEGSDVHRCSVEGKERGAQQR
jgi:hypothetical protein